jgi:hypothetical protein
MGRHCLIYKTMAAKCLAQWHRPLSKRCDSICKVDFVQQRLSKAKRLNFSLGISMQHIVSSMRVNGDRDLLLVTTGSPYAGPRL